MALAQRIVRLGHRLREESNLRVRQPLAELRVGCPAEVVRFADPRTVICHLEDVIKEELNVKQITVCESLDDLVRYEVKPNLKTLGPKYGKLLSVIKEKLPQLPAETLAPLRAGENVTVELDGHQIVLLPEDVLIQAVQAEGWHVGEEAGLQVALNTELTPELKREGMARDFVRQVQNLRKQADLDIADRIRVYYEAASGQDGDEQTLRQMLDEWGDYIAGETLADSIEPRAAKLPHEKKGAVGEIQVIIGIEKQNRSDTP